jgi:exodeoxyribonuclease VII small subunit
MTTKSFEDALKELENIVTRMEDGDLPLEDALRLFEQGVRLSRQCHEKLEEAQRKVEILLKEEEKTVPKPFEPVGEE